MGQSQIDGIGARMGSLKSYATGFVLSIILTIISFALVMSGVFTRPVIFAGIFSAGVAQMIVHLHYFLHLDTSSSSRWNLMALLFAVLLIFVFVGGTIWIMYNLSYRLG